MTLDNNILNQLNESQRKAVENISGPVMIIAGAGSGKTRALTYRVAHLINQKVDPFHILCLTFTNKAAGEMKERIMQLVGSEARNVWMGTFHSVFARILRFDGHLLGYPQNFSIYDTDDSKSLLRNIMREMEIDVKAYPVNYVLSRISNAKSSLLSADDYNNNQEILEQDRAAHKPFIGQIYIRYQNRLFKAGAMDFDDLLFNTNLLFRDFPEVLYKYQEKFQYILVDEYQDTNYSQYLIVKKIASRFENICVVGDDAQSIYAFRGANIQNILNFKNDYPDYKLFKLEQNYRSTQNIVKAANSIIANNVEQIEKDVWTHNEVGFPIKIARLGSDTEEGAYIAGSIFEIKMNEQLRNDAFAVLYRTNAQSRPIEEALRRLNIPYKMFGGQSFYSRKEIKDLLAYIRLAVNPLDEEALRRVINYPARSIGDTTMNKFTELAGQANLPLWEIISHASDYKLNLGSKTLTSVNDFVTMIHSFAAQLQTRNAYDLALHIAKVSGIMKHLKEDESPEGISHLENLEALLNAVQEYVERQPLPEEDPEQLRDLATFLQEISLLTDQDRDDKNDTDKVLLMTIHQAKGLEFPYVYIAGVEENLFPSFLSINTRSELEEERRLFYVALTRAMKRVFVSYAESRYRWGQLEVTERSRFIDEIDEKYVEKTVQKQWRTSAGVYHTKEKDFSGYKTKEPEKPVINPINKIKGNFKKLNTYSKNNEDNSSVDSKEDAYPHIKVGVKVMHASFGMGEVKSIEGSGPNKKASVNFATVGLKQLLLRFAKMEVIE